MAKMLWIGMVAIAVTVAVVGAAVMGGWLGGNENNKVHLTQTGSSTVLPLAVAWAEEFKGADISVSGGGSSHGLNALLLGEADLGDASRLLKGSDYTAVNGDATLVSADGTATGAAPSGVLPMKWVVAYDVLAVVVNNENDWATQLTYDQLRHIFAYNDSQPSAVCWDDVPGLTGAPHEAIEIYAPDEASGTYDYFFESIIKDWGKPTQAMKPRLESTDGVYHPSADDNVIMNAISSKKNAIGYFGFAYLVENPGVVTPIKLAKTGTTYIEPSFANVATYPMARPLHIYTNGMPDETTPKGGAIADYLRFILGEGGQAMVPDVGYVKLELVNAALLDEQRAKLEG
ncbi:MAG: substrate-binding domain-containing protein [Methanobacteriota archaeon]